MNLRQGDFLEPFAYACAGGTAAFLSVSEWFMAGFACAVCLVCIALIGRKTT